MPAKLPQREVDAAWAAVAFAQQVRKLHRRRSPRTDRARQRDLKLAAERVAAAMRPLRSERGRSQYGPQTSIAEANREKIRLASEALQVERRKLWKMR